MRTFAAIALNAELCDALSAAIRAMQAERPPLKPKWVRPGDQHLTLHFFGEVDPRRAEDIQAAMERAAAKLAPFDLTTADLGCFPNIYKPNVLWVGIHEPSGALKRLQAELDGEFARLGYAAEPRAFRPHLTLARVPHDANSASRKALGEWFVQQLPPLPVVQRVQCVCLVRSDPPPAGHRYMTIASAALAAAV